MSNDLLHWFFENEQSTQGYELAEVVAISGASKADIQNWVTRGHISPWIRTAGRRIYDPLTVADIAVGVSLLRAGLVPATALEAGKVANRQLISGSHQEAGSEYIDGVTQWPAVTNDISTALVLIYWPDPSKPRDVRAAAFRPADMADNIMYFSKQASAVSLVHVGQIWTDLAAMAQRIKNRPGKRLVIEGDD